MPGGASAGRACTAPAASTHTKTTASASLPMHRPYAVLPRATTRRSAREWQVPRVTGAFRLQHRFDASNTGRNGLSCWQRASYVVAGSLTTENLDSLDRVIAVPVNLVAADGRSRRDAHADPSLPTR